MQIRAEHVSHISMVQRLLQVRIATISCRPLKLRLAVLYVRRLLRAGLRMKLFMCLTLQLSALIQACT